MASIPDDTLKLSKISKSNFTLETSKDTLRSVVLLQIQEGHGLDSSDDLVISPHKPTRESDYEQKRVLVYQDGVIVPSSLHKKVLEHLYAGIRAQQQRNNAPIVCRRIVYWPRMSNDIRCVCVKCCHCSKNAPL